MLKQWENTSLNCYYVFLRDSSGEENSAKILTSDGLLFNYENFKVLTREQYDNLKKTGYKYDYQLTIQNEKLTKTASQPSLLKSANRVANNAPMARKILINNTKDKPNDIPITDNNSPADEKIQIQEEIKVQPEIPVKTEVPVKTINTNIRKSNTSTSKADIINIIERLIMLIVSLMTIILSIYYTRTYLMQTNGKLIATLLSVSMLLYSLIGLQIVAIFKKKKNYIRTFLFFITSITTIGFSMFTSLDVNITKYLENSKVIEQERIKTDTSTLIIDTIKQQKEQNRKTAEMLMSDIAYYTERKLNTYTQREQLKQLDAEYSELTQKEIDILSQDNSASQSEQKRKSQASSLVEIISNLCKINKDTLQMFIMCFASIFIDVIAPLALNMAVYGKK